MKKIAMLLTAGCLSVLVAQPPPPAVPSGPISSVSGPISQLNFDREGAIDGFVLSSNTLVHLPPRWALQLESFARPGGTVKATGVVTPTASGMQILDVQSLEIAGQTFSNVTPNPPAPFAASGTIRQLNYGPRGEVDGFLLDNGTLAATPPFGANPASALKPGSMVGISGFAHQTPGGRNVVDVQSITVNGQTIALNAGPRGPLAEGPARLRGPREGRLSPPPPDAPAPPPAR